MTFFSKVENLKKIKELSILSPIEEAMINLMIRVTEENEETLTRFRKFLTIVCKVDEDIIPELVEININSKIDAIIQSEDFMNTLESLPEAQHPNFFKDLVTNIFKKWLTHIEYPEDLSDAFCNVFVQFFEGFLALMKKHLEDID